MVESKINAGKTFGRPRKDPLQKIKHSSKVFYFPIDKDHDIVWAEFERLCQENKKPFLYNKNRFYKKGVIIKRLIMNHVISFSKNEKVIEITKNIIIRENKERINNWEKNTGKKYSPTS